MSKKKHSKTIIDTSTVTDIKARLHREAVKKLMTWKEQSSGTSTEINFKRKGLHSILKKASNLGKVSAEKCQKMMEEKKAKKEKAKKTSTPPVLR